MKRAIKLCGYVLAVVVLVGFGSCKKSKLKLKNLEGVYVGEIWDRTDSTIKEATITFYDTEWEDSETSYKCTWVLDGYDPVETYWVYLEGNQQVSQYRQSGFFDPLDYEDYDAVTAGINFVQEPGMIPILDMILDYRPEFFYEDKETFLVGWGKNTVLPYYKFVKQ